VGLNKIIVLMLAHLGKPTLLWRGRKGIVRDDVAYVPVRQHLSEINLINQHKS